MVTDALPFPGLAGGLVRPGDVLVRLEDPRKAPSVVDVTEDAVLLESDAGEITVPLANVATGRVQLEMKRLADEEA